MDSVYKSCFAEAIGRTAKYQIELSNEDIRSIWTHDRKYVTKENYTSVGQHIFNSIGANHAYHTAFECLKYSVLSKPLIDEYLGIKTLLTIGYIVENGREPYKFSEVDIINMIHRTPTKYFNQNACIHIWLTLPSFEIFDLTLLETKNTSNGNPFHKGRGYDYIFDSIENIFNRYKFTYMPMLIGVDSLVKLNLLSSEATIEDLLII